MNKFFTTLSLFIVSVTLAAKSYNVKDFGAIADTTVLSSPFIQKAVDECAANGGGVVVVPAGNYLCGSIFLKSNVELHLEAGSTLFASRRSSDYPKAKVSVGASDADRVDILIAALDVENISITGTGSLNGQAVRESFRREPQLALTDSVTGREIANAIKYGVDYQTKFRKVPPCPGLINFTNCKNVHIENIQVVESSFWSVHLQWCDRVFVDGIYIYSAPSNGVNADGLDIDGCSNVMVSNSVINTGDDALCLKTTSQDKISKPCENVTVTNCIFTSSSAAIKLGTESFSDFRNITISNCIVKDANRGINMIIRDGGAVSNVLFSNIVINTVRKATFWWGNGDAVWMTIQARRKEKPAGKIENISFDHIIAHSQSGVRIEGFDNVVNNIRFNDFQLFMEPENAKDKRSRNGFLFNGVARLLMNDCAVSWNTSQSEDVWESAYYFENVNGLTLNRTLGEQAPNKRYPAIRKKNTSNVSIDGKSQK